MSDGKVTEERFVEMGKTGQTNFTTTMGNLFANPGALPDQYPDEVQELRQEGGLDVLSDKIKAALPESSGEFNSIDSWSSQQKEQVRQKLVQAIDENRPVRFCWELHRGEHEVTNIVDNGAGNDITMTFLSPWRKVRVADDGSGDIIQDP